MDDRKLAVKLKQHNEQAFEEVIKKYTPLVATIIGNLSNGRLTHSDVEGVTTDVFVTLWKNAEILKEETLKSYLCCIAKSRAKDRLRKNKFGNIVDISEIEQADTDLIDENFEQKELNILLRQEIDQIKQPDREIIIRYYYYYQSVSKIAEAMEMNVETVKSKLKRTRKKLKEALAKRGY